ncbi:hypothetical protein [Vibrio aerogenes]|uniref:hypothetical protein n=1 Tax=Vibrio aerogenes TaxID=92172 RepID=UPI0021C2E582|nr:hypothetical protein [Vibrio aerogenes]
MEYSGYYGNSVAEHERWLDLLESPCMLPLSSSMYQQPTPEQARLVRQYLGLSQIQLGHFLGQAVSFEGCLEVQLWESEHRIDSGNWRLMLAAAGLCDLREDLLFLKMNKNQPDVSG